ncbi:spore maturation protein SpmB [Catenulispora sp. GAS73]|uniref:hypothetical protein n=1 Tax=Catenulispora sp. GAS73 TaxID=3156269 RepID=UPI003511D79E
MRPDLVRRRALDSWSAVALAQAESSPGAVLGVRPDLVRRPAPDSWSAAVLAQAESSPGSA